MIYGLGASGVSVSGMMDKWEGTAASVASQAIRGLDFSGLAKSAGYRVPDVLAQLSAGARINALAEELNKTIFGKQDIYAPALQQLARTLDFYRPPTFEKAVRLVKANPEAVEATRELIKEHPEEAQKLASKVSSDKIRDLFPGSARSNASLSLSWFEAFGNISIAGFSGTTGAPLAYATFISVMLAVVASVIIIDGEKNDSRKQIDPPEGK